MAQKKSPKKKKNPVPVNIVYKAVDDNFCLYKQWNRDTIAKDPFYIADNLEDLIDELRECCDKWKIKLDLKEFYKFINKNKDQNEEANLPKSYFSQ